MVLTSELVQGLAYAGLEDDDAAVERLGENPALGETGEVRGLVEHVCGSDHLENVVRGADLRVVVQLLEPGQSRTTDSDSTLVLVREVGELVEIFRW